MPNVHLVPDVIANPYLLIDADGLTLIDAGLPGSDKKILKYMAERGFSPSDLRRILITHADADHVGGLAALQRDSGARVHASAIEAEAIRQGRPSRQSRPASVGLRLIMGIVSRLFRARPAAVDEVLEDGQVLPVLGGLHVLATPGHTPGHTSFFSPSIGVLFAGDSIVSRRGRLVSSIPAKTSNAQAAAQSVRRQAELGPRVVCSGHGPIVTDASAKMPAA